MNSKRMFQVVVAGAVLLAPFAAGAQADSNQTGNGGFSAPQMSQPGVPSGNQGMAPGGGNQSNQNSSMRDSLGAPGQTGQQMLDKQFIRTAIEDGLLDVKLGTLAEQKGSAEVKDAAEKMVADHEDMNKDLETIADALGVMVPKKVNRAGQAEYEKLNRLSGKDFDTEYLTFTLKAHFETAHNFYMEATAAADPDLQALVVKDLGLMHAHFGLVATAAKAEDITLPARPPRPGTATTAAK